MHLRCRAGEEDFVSYRDWVPLTEFWSVANELIGPERLAATGTLIVIVDCTSVSTQSSVLP